jgi:hypothetical protein
VGESPDKGLQGDLAGGADQIIAVADGIGEKTGAALTIEFAHHVC